MDRKSRSKSSGRDAGNDGYRRGIVARLVPVPVPVAAQELPPDVLADQLLTEASEASESGGRREAFRKFRAVDAPEAELAPDFACRYCKTLVEYRACTDAWRKGRSLLMEYVGAAD